MPVAPTGTNWPYACSASSLNMSVYATLAGGTLSFTQTETSGYLPLNDTFTTTWTMGAGSPAAPVSLVYDWGDGTPTEQYDNLSSPDIRQHTYTRRSGSLGWKVSITATDICGNSQNVWRYIVILAPPVLGGTTNASPQVGVAPVSVNFAVTPPAASRPTRSSGTSATRNTSSAQNPDHIYTTPGAYLPRRSASATSGPATTPASRRRAAPTSGQHWTDPINAGRSPSTAGLNVTRASTLTSLRHARDPIGTGTFSLQRHGLRRRLELRPTVELRRARRVTHLTPHRTPTTSLQQPRHLQRGPARCTDGAGPQWVTATRSSSPSTRSLNVTGP